MDDDGKQSAEDKKTGMTLLRKMEEDAEFQA